MVWPEPIGRRRFSPAIAAPAIAAAVALVYYCLRPTDGGGDLEPLYRAAAEARQTAEAQLQAGRLDLAEAACGRALTILNTLESRAAGAPRYRRERAALAETLGLCQAGAGVADEAIPAYKEAIDVWSKLLAEIPDSLEDRCRLAACLLRLGILCRDAGRWDEAESTLMRGRLLCETVPKSLSDHPRVARDRIGFLGQLGGLFLETGRPAEAIECEMTAVTVAKGLAGSAAGTRADREALVSMLTNLARVYGRLGRAGDAEHALAEAADVAERLRVDLPSEPRLDDLAATVLELRASTATARQGATRPAEARDLFDRALAIRERLAADARATPEDAAKLVATYDSLGSLCRDERAYDKAEVYYRKALPHQARLAGAYPGVASYRFDHGRLLHNLADLLRGRGRGRQEEALALTREAVNQLGAVYRDNVNNPDYRTAYSYATWTLCALLLDREELPAAAEAIAEYRKIDPRGYEEPLEAARFLCRCARLRGADRTRPAPRPEPPANTDTDQAMSALILAVQNGFRDVRELETSPVYDPLRSRDDFRRLVREVGSK